MANLIEQTNNRVDVDLIRYQVNENARRSQWTNVGSTAIFIKFRQTQEIIYYDSDQPGFLVPSNGPFLHIFQFLSSPGSLNIKVTRENDPLNTYYLLNLKFRSNSHRDMFLKLRIAYIGKNDGISCFRLPPDDFFAKRRLKSRYFGPSDDEIQRKTVRLFLNEFAQVNKNRFRILYHGQQSSSTELKVAESYEPLHNQCNEIVQYIMSKFFFDGTNNRYPEVDGLCGQHGKIFDQHDSEAEILDFSRRIDRDILGILNAIQSCSIQYNCFHRNTLAIFLASNFYRPHIFSYGRPNRVSEVESITDLHEKTNILKQAYLDGVCHKGSKMMLVDCFELQTEENGSAITMNRFLTFMSCAVVDLLELPENTNNTGKFSGQETVLIDNNLELWNALIILSGGGYNYDIPVDCRNPHRQEAYVKFARCAKRRNRSNRNMQYSNLSWMLLVISKKTPLPIAEFLSGPSRLESHSQENEERDFENPRRHGELPNHEEDFSEPPAKVKRSSNEPRSNTNSGQETAATEKLGQHALSSKTSFFTNPFGTMQDHLLARRKQMSRLTYSQQNIIKNPPLGLINVPRGNSYKTSGCFQNPLTGASTQSFAYRGINRQGHEQNEKPKPAPTGNAGISLNVGHLRNTVDPYPQSSNQQFIPTTVRNQPSCRPVYPPMQSGINKNSQHGYQQISIPIAGAISHSQPDDLEYRGNSRYSSSLHQSSTQTFNSRLMKRKREK